MTNVTYYNAGAGSGKTHTLITVLTDLIRRGEVEPEQVILTTFTTAAATEFREKAKARLYAEGMTDKAERLDQAMMGTVHSVCQHFIAKYWFDLGLAPTMGVMAEEDEAFYLAQSLAGLPTDAELRELHAFADFFDIRKPQSTELHEDYWMDELREVINLATNHEITDFDRSERESVTLLRSFAAEAAPTASSPLDPAFVREVLTEHLAFMEGQKRTSAANNARIDILRESMRHTDHLTMGRLKAIDGTIGTPSKYGPLAEEFHLAMAGIWQSDDILSRMERHIRLIFSLARQWQTHFAAYKRQKNLIDFNDMEKYMCRLMQDENVAREVSQAYRYLFVDEFQDSSPIQVKIFDALSAQMAHTYLVGDYKQAIYGFRGSDTQLTKAVVDRIAALDGGRDIIPLEYSWRSLPEIVEVCNGVFTHVFSDVLTEEQVRLKPHRTNEDGTVALRYIRTNKECTTAMHVAQLVEEGTSPRDIAVLAYRNNELDGLAQELKQRYGIPCNRGDMPATQTLTWTLIASVLRVVASPRDTLAKAQIAYLVEPDYTTARIIEEKIRNIDWDESAEEYLEDDGLVSSILYMRSRLEHQSISALVESAVIELNLYNYACRLPEDPMMVDSVIDTVMATARTYEDHCVQQNLPWAIEGFIAYFDQVNPKASGDPNGVRLMTYHGSKGLEWKYVFLNSLGTDVADEEKALRHGIFGVHAIRQEAPSTQTPYPEVHIRVLPWVYGVSRAKTPEGIRRVLDTSPEGEGGTSPLAEAKAERLAEWGRLLYVGMTRARDVLIPVIDESKKNAVPLLWPKAVGADRAGQASPTAEGWDIFGTGHTFRDATLTDEEAAGWKEREMGNTLYLSMVLKHTEPRAEARAPRYLAPSMVHTRGEVTAHHDFGKRIMTDGAYDVTEVGNCVHQIFAAIDEPHTAAPDRTLEMVEQTIAAYGLTAALPMPQDIIDAYRRLTDYLTQHCGPAVRILHERPFRHERDGQLVVGSIDLVWQTAEGDVLVDYKTCPMSPRTLVDPHSDHYAGWYAGQLDAYEDALTAAGERVLRRYIYYPVNGMIAEVGRTPKPAGSGESPRTFILKWNPAISSFKADDYRHALEDFPNGFEMNWSVWEWEAAHQGDDFYMLAVGDGPRGIMFCGKFLSEPYEDGDWSGRGRTTYYVDIACYDATELDNPGLTVDTLEAAIPDFDWRKGHSGALLTPEQASILHDLWEERRN